MDAGKVPTGSMSPDQINNVNFIRTGNYNTGEYLIPDIVSITLGINEFQSNRLQNFNLKVTPKKLAVYNMGSKTPKRVDYFGADVALECSFEIGDFEIKRLRDFPLTGMIRNLNLQINDYRTNQNIANYSFNNLNLVNDNLSVSANENVLVNLTFATKIYGG